MYAEVEPVPFRAKLVSAKPSIRRVAVIATGVIGRSWIQIFARAGCEVRVFDANPDQLRKALDWFETDTKDQRARGVLKKKEARGRLDRVQAAESLEEAVADAGYIQENGPEDLAIKNALYLEIDRAARPDAIIASSTSTLDMTEIARGIPGAARCIVAHPVNPPHVVPAVEILGGQATDPKVIKKAVKFMKELGQTPVLMSKFVPGFVINRMQAALVREAVDLVAKGICDVEAIDDSLRNGLGLRWALMGPFGVANTNADGGVAEYFTRYRSSFHNLWKSLNSDVTFDDELVARLGRETNRFITGSYADQRAWRDRQVMAIRRLKGLDPPPTKAKKQSRRKKR
jgi:3-hydroxyacyl-CoA dehydrogenase